MGTSNLYCLLFFLCLGHQERKTIQRKDSGNVLEEGGWFLILGKVNFCIEQKERKQYMKWFNGSAVFLLVMVVCSSAWAAEDGPFDQYIRPLSNPVYNIDPRNETTVRVAHLRQNMPSHINTTLGRVKLGGDLNVTALQLTYAFNERFSLVAEKTGYIDFNPNNTLEDETGWADYGAGVKYAFIYDPDSKFILSSRVLFEMSQGSRDVFQGNGSGNVAPSLHFLKGFDKLQLNGGIGVVIPFDGDEESTVLFDTWHISYAVTPWFFPLIELNHFRVLDDAKRDELVASVVSFEGGDLINFGAHHGKRNKDIVTLAIGSRFRVLQDVAFIKNMDIGVGYEFPLTDKNDNLMEDRFTFDVVFFF